MNRTKTFLPFIVLTIGLIGLFMFPSLIIFDGGLYDDLNIMRESEYKNTDGDALYTMQQVEDHLELYAKGRSSMWAIDISSVYMFFGGLIALSINRKSIGKALKLKGGKKSLIVHIVAGIPFGILFWFLAWRIFWLVGMPLH